MENRCTNCGISTNDSDDVHCRRFLKLEIEKMKSAGMVDDAAVFVNEFKFKNELSEIWKNTTFSNIFSLYKEENTKSRLFDLRKKLYSSQQIDDNDLCWLEANGNYNELGDYYFQCYRNFPKTVGYKDAWFLSKASKYYRKANKPEKALEITEKMPIDNKQALAAVLTSRGGVFKDLERLEDAKECAEKAIRIFPTYHPYLLLGAVNIEQKKYDEAFNAFDKATELGAAEKLSNLEIQRVITIKTYNEKINIIKYLIKRDPVKYKWVEKFVDAEEIKQKNSII